MYGGAGFGGGSQSRARGLLLPWGSLNCGPVVCPGQILRPFRGSNGGSVRRCPQGRIVACSLVLVAKCRKVPDLGFLRRGGSRSGRRALRLQKRELRCPAESYRTPVSCLKILDFLPWNRNRTVPRFAARREDHRSVPRRGLGRKSFVQGEHFQAVAIRVSKVGLRPRNKGVAVNLAVESMGRCQFGCRDYALGTQIDRSRPRSRPSPCFRRSN